MFNVGSQELLIIFFVVLMLFGAKRIPEVARSLGEGMRDLKKAMAGIENELKIDVDEKSPRPVPRPKPVPATTPDLQAPSAAGPGSATVAGGGTEPTSPSAAAPEGEPSAVPTGDRGTAPRPAPAPAPASAREGGAIPAERPKGWVGSRSPRGQKPIRPAGRTKDGAPESPAGESDSAETVSGDESTSGSDRS